VDFDYGTSIGLLARTGTPAAIIARLEAAVARDDRQAGDRARDGAWHECASSKLAQIVV
jgi:hypothetical protein